MVKKITNKMTLKSLKISWWGQNSVAGHIQSQEGPKLNFLLINVRSSLIFMISNYCHHLFIIRWSAAKRRPASTSWSRWTALWTSSHTWFSSSTIHLSSSSGFGLIASNFIKYIDYLDPGQTICATSTPSLCSPLWLGAVLEKWKKFHVDFNCWLPS